MKEHDEDNSYDSIEDLLNFDKLPEHERKSVIEFVERYKKRKDLEEKKEKERSLDNVEKQLVADNLNMKNYIKRRRLVDLFFAIFVLLSIITYNLIWKNI